MEGERAEPNLFPEQVDVLVQKWRDEVTNAHEIQQTAHRRRHQTERLAGNYLHILIVPPGQPFPDPMTNPGTNPQEVV